LGIVTAAVGLNRRAVVLFGALYRVCPWVNNTVAPILVAQYEEAMQSALTALGEVEFQAAWEEGRSMTYDQMLAYVLEDQD